MSARIFEDAILADPDDPSTYLVYADWLQAQGDPRGELIVLQHRGVDAAPHFAAHPELLGPLATFISSATSPSSRHLAITWRRGFVDTLDLGWGMYNPGNSPASATRELVEILRHPSCKFLQALAVGPVPSEDIMSFGRVVDAIEQVGGIPTLRRLDLGKTSDWDLSSTQTGDFHRIAAVCKGLVEVRLHGGDVTIGEGIALPELRSFTVETGGLSTFELAHLDAARWPKLERLVLWFGLPDYGGNARVTDLASILAGRGLPNLTHLGLKNCPWIDEVIAALPGSAILPRLRSLDVSMGALSDAAIGFMVRHADAFRHLERIDVDDNALTEATRATLAAFTPAIAFGRQHPERAASAELAERYCAVGE